MLVESDMALRTLFAMANARRGSCDRPPILSTDVEWTDVEGIQPFASRLETQK